MGNLRTLCLFLLVLPATVAASPSETRDRTALFAACAGRYSAVMEHAWLLGAHDAIAESRRAGFVDLLDAVRPASGIAGAALLDMRIRAKHALAQTLQISAFHTDAGTRQRAAGEARRSLRLCEMLLLS